MNRVDTSMVTTANELAGYRIVRSYGMVRGIIVRSRSVCCCNTPRSTAPMPWSPCVTTLPK